MSIRAGAAGARLSGLPASANLAGVAPTDSVEDAVKKLAGVIVGKAPAGWINEDPFAAASTVTAPFLEAIETVATDGVGSVCDWPNNGHANLISMTGGTVFCWYQAQNNVQRIMRRDPSGVWSVVKEITTDCTHMDLGRDPSTNLLFALNYENPNGIGTYPYVPKLRVFNEDGTQRGSTYTLQTQFPRSQTVNGAYQCFTVGRGGRLALHGFTELMPSTERRSATKSAFIQFQSLLYDATAMTFTPDPIRRKFIGDRSAYHISAWGVTGNPDELCGLANRDVLWTEDDQQGQFVPNAGSTYLFNGIYYFKFNRLSGDIQYFPVVEPAKWLLASTDTPNASGADTPQLRARIGTVDRQGNLMTVYYKNRPTGANAGTASFWLLRVSPFGEVLTNDQISTVTYGHFGLRQLSNGQLYALYFGNGSQRTEFHALRLNQNADGSWTMDAKSAANNMNATDLPLVGSVAFGNAQASGVYGPVCTPVRNVVATPIQDDVCWGSKPHTNTAFVLVSRRPSDLPTGGSTGDSTGHIMEFAKLRLPLS